MYELSIKRLSSEYIERELEIFNSVFGRDYSREDWEKKHFCNPYGNTVFVGAFHNDKLIGINGFMPMEFALNDRIYYAAESCDTAVLPECRGHGVFSKIISEAQEILKSEGFDFIFGWPNPNSYPGFIKLGWSTVEKYVYCGCIANISEWFKEKKKTGYRLLSDSIMLANFMRSIIRKRVKYEFIPIDAKEFISGNKVSANILGCCYTREFVEWKLTNIGNIYKVINKDKEVGALVTKHSTIAYIDIYEKDIDEAVFVHDICRTAFDKFGQHNILIEENRVKEFYRAGMVSRRLPTQYTIFKGLTIEGDEEERLKSLLKVKLLEGD